MISGSAFFFMSCDDDDDNKFVPESAVTQAFDIKYPGATLFEIDKEYNGTEVDILHERIHKEVWLDMDNQWVLTRWEIRSSSLPDVVMSAFRSSEYASYRIDDLHVVERPDGIFYEFELEWRDRDLTILFGEDGTLVSPAY